MSILSRIRDNIGLVAIIIFVALLAFILTDLVSGITTIFGGPPPAGVVAGETISWNDYQQRLSNQPATETEQQRGQIADQVWQQMVREKIYEQEMEAIGLEVTGDEVYNMLTGPTPHPFVTQYLLQNQEYDPNLVKNWLNNLLNSGDPQARAQLREVESYLQNLREEERLRGIVSAAWLSSPAKAKWDYTNQNRNANISYLSVPYTTIADSTIPVSDAEIRSYMEENEAQYEQDEQALIRYVTFDLTPSPEDTAKALNDIIATRVAFENAGNDSVFTSIRSSQPYSPGNFQPISNLPTALRDSIYGAEEGTVFGPIQEGGLYKLYKLVASEAAENQAAKISHIFITPEGSTAADTAAARDKAAQLTREARSGDFAEVAQENSDDVASAPNGGSLGWYARGRFGAEFDEAVDNASVGSVIGPVEGPGGFHVIRIEAKDDQSYDVAQIEKEIIASTETRNRIRGEANQFAARLRASGNINTAAEEAGKVAFASSGLTKTSRILPGLQGGRDVIVWALYSELNETSGVFTVNNSKLVVAQVVEKKEAGLPALTDDLRESVGRRVRAEKKAELIKERLAGISGTDLNAMRDAYNSAHGGGASINTATNINFNTNTIPGMGADNKVIGKVTGMAQGEISGPIDGINGVYIVQVTSVTEATEPAPSVLSSNIMTQQTQGGSTLGSRFEMALREEAEVEDQRAKVEYQTQVR